jgi:hypothetical protein
MLPRGAEAALDRLELDARGHLGALHPHPVDEPVAEVAETHAHAAHVQTLAVHRLERLADDELGAATADVDDQAPAPVSSERMRDAQVDQACLLPTGDDLDGVAERTLGIAAEGLGIARATQGVGTDGTHRPGCHRAQPLAEARKARERPLDRIGGQIPALVEPGGQPHRLAQLVDDREMPVRFPGNEEMEAVRAEIHRREHGRRNATGEPGFPRERLAHVPVVSSAGREQATRRAGKSRAKALPSPTVLSTRSCLSWRANPCSTIASPRRYGIADTRLGG